jgi:CO/xanthine dehydrogenase Mo-binding subunit
MLRVSRRSLLKNAAGLVVAFSLPRALALPAAASERTVATDSVDAYLAIAPDGSATVFAGKVDLGTGARAAVRQIVAEELGMAPERIGLVEGDTALTPDQGSTGGSTGIMVGGVRIRQAAATARAHLLALASPVLHRPAGDLDTRDGSVVVRGGHGSASFAQLIGGSAFDLLIDEAAPLRDPDGYTIVGTSYPRPDIPAKLTARHVYVQDHRVDGMLHARVLRPPAVGARLRDVDEASLAGIPGVQTVRLRDFLAVAAPREWDAIRALRRLKASWSEAAMLPGSDRLFEAVRATPVARVEALKAVGDAAAALAAAPRVIRASYAWPVQSHASMGPSCAVADIRDGGGTVWTASQGTHRLRRTIADLLGLDAARLRLIYMDGSGSYGSNGNDDVAFEAALLSRELRRPVRVQWMREDEQGWDPKGPPQLLDLRAALAADGTIAAWETVAMVPQNTPHRAGVPLLAAVAAGLDDGAGQSAGLTSLNSDPPYAIGNVRVDVRWLTTTPIRPSNLRAPGKIGNVFAVESFFDELAAAAGDDPLARRLRLLADPRGREVLERVGAMMDWQPRTAPPDRSGKLLGGRGIAYVHYKQAENYVAMGVEAEVEPATGMVRVTRVACAHDCGLMINPDAVRAQVEGCILQTLSRTLFEEVTFDRSRVTSTNWATYPILTFPDVPKLDTALIERRHERPLGAGEAATAPVAAAVGNAIFDAAGIRLRRVPFTPARVKEALAQQAT